MVAANNHAKTLLQGITESVTYREFVLVDDQLDFFNSYREVRS